MDTIADSELKLAYIKVHSLDRHCSPHLVKSMRFKKVASGEYLIAQGSRQHSLYLLVEGKLQVEHYEQDDNRAAFSIEEAFTVIGDLELFQDEKTEAVNTVKAITEVSILELPLSMVERYGLKDPAFLRFICQQLSNKLYASSQLHSNTAFKSVFKVRKYLAFRAESEGNTIQLEKRDAIAAMLGVSVRQLNRSLKELALEGAIEVKNKTAEVLDRALLSDVSPTDI